jgi:hypothetical protein
MPTLYVETEINAAKSMVWQVILNKEKWLYWNTFLFDRNPNLPFEVGQKLFLSLRRVSGEEETEFHPVVTRVQPETCLMWTTQIFGFRNQHVFELQEIGVNRTKYVHREIFNGWLVPIFLPFIRQDERQGMKRMAQELKSYVEEKSAKRQSGDRETEY